MPGINLRSFRRRMVGGGRTSFLAGCGQRSGWRMMGACSGFAGSSGGLCGAGSYAPLTAPRPAPRFTVHKGFSLQEQPLSTAPRPEPGRGEEGRTGNCRAPLRHAIFRYSRVTS